jgi:hypothetical protein
MRRFIATWTIILTLLAPAAAAPPRTEFTSAESVLRWINTYRLKPERPAVIDAVQASSRFGAFRDPDGAGVYVGFLAGIIGSDAPPADELIGKLFPLPDEDQWVVVRAIVYSGLPDWKDLLRRTSPRMPTRERMITKYLAGRSPTLEQVAFERSPSSLETLRSYLRMDNLFSSKSGKPVALEPTPDLIDTLWGYYFATGSYAPVARIIAMLPWSKDNESLEKLTLGSIAKYTLATNAARHADLLAMLKRASRHQRKEVTPMLAAVIEAAETVETGRLRKEALAAIEELRRKGPGSHRELSWWGQIGQGTLAVGCLVAAATGHVELGLPCVVGGGVSTAALNYWDKQQAQ